jgi:signal transduction histidine kinase
VTGSDWGTLTLYAVVVTATFRLRWQIAFWPDVPAALLLIYTQGLAGLLFEHRPGSMLITTLLILLCALSASAGQRSRALLIMRLRRTTDQLRSEMTRTAELATSQERTRIAELATSQERTRIARDINDVLAHSLTALSIQVQAARQVVRDQPERAAALLDEMAGVLRESQAESR